LLLVWFNPRLLYFLSIADCGLKVMSINTHLFVSGIRHLLFC